MKVEKMTRINLLTNDIQMQNIVKSSISFYKSTFNDGMMYA